MLFSKFISSKRRKISKMNDFYTLIPPGNIIFKLGYSLESLWSGDMSRCKCHHETWKAVFFDECTFLAHMEIVRVITFVWFQNKKNVLAAMNLVSQLHLVLRWLVPAFGPYGYLSPICKYNSWSSIVLWWMHVSRSHGNWQSHYFRGV